MDENPYQSPEAEVKHAIVRSPWRSAAWRGAKVGAVTGGLFLGTIMAGALIDMTPDQPRYQLLWKFAIGLAVTVIASGLIGSIVCAIGSSVAAILQHRKPKNHTVFP